MIKKLCDVLLTIDSVPPWGFVDTVDCCVYHELIILSTTSVRIHRAIGSTNMNTRHMSSRWQFDYYRSRKNKNHTISLSWNISERCRVDLGRKTFEFASSKYGVSYCDVCGREKSACRELKNRAPVDVNICWNYSQSTFRHQLQFIDDSIGAAGLLSYNRLLLSRYRSRATNPQICWLDKRLDNARAEAFVQKAPTLLASFLSRLAREALPTETFPRIYSWITRGPKKVAGI